MVPVSCSKGIMAMPRLEASYPSHRASYTACSMARVSCSRHLDSNHVKHRHRRLAHLLRPGSAAGKKLVTSASALQGPDGSPQEGPITRIPSTNQDGIERNEGVNSSSSSSSATGQQPPDQPQGSAGPPTLAPTDVITWGGNLPSTRRFLVGSALASVLALGADFLGITSSILGLNPEAARSARVDLLYPVGGFKRCLERSRGFGQRLAHPANLPVHLPSLIQLSLFGELNEEFIYPSSWLGDQRLVYRAVERSERERSLDPPSLRDSGPRIRSSGGGTGAAAQPVEPLVAFGPAGGSGELNVSVIVADVPSDFRLERFGDAEAVGTRLLENIIAPKGSGLEATLLEASQRTLGGVLYYEIEFKVAGPSFRRHNLSVFCVYNSQLFSINGQAPETGWASVEDSFRVSAATFKVLQ